jgi:hypothetical protein
MVHYNRHRVSTAREHGFITDCTKATLTSPQLIKVNPVPSLFYPAWVVPTPLVSPGRLTCLAPRVFSGPVPGVIVKIAQIFTLLTFSAGLSLLLLNLWV